MHQAVELVETIQAKIRSKQTNSKPVTAKSKCVSLDKERGHPSLDERIGRLNVVIVKELALPRGNASRPTEQTQQLLKLLFRLGPNYAKQAQTLFFETQNTEIEKTMEHVRFEGDLSKYVAAISYCLFDLLQEAVIKYQSLFVAGQYALPFTSTSSLMVWIMRHQLAEFCALLRRHISMTDDVHMASKCLCVALQQCQFMEQHGVQLSPQLRLLMQPDAIQAVSACQAPISARLSAVISGKGRTRSATEDWVVRKYQMATLDPEVRVQSSVYLTISGNFLQEGVAQFLHGVQPLHAEDQCAFGMVLFTPVVSGVAAIFSNYVEQLRAAMASVVDATSAMLGVMANLWAISQYYIPQALQFCTREFGRPPYKLQHVLQPVEAVYDHVFTMFVSSVVETIANNHLSCRQIMAVYKAATNSTPAPEPSENIRRSANQLLSVTSHAFGCVESVVHQRLVNQLWTAIAEQMLAGLQSGAAESHTGGEGAVTGVVAALSPTGRSQLALDCHFMAALFKLACDTDAARQIPPTWRGLLRAVAATSQAEGADVTAADCARSLWKLLSPQV
eukprot:COSAG01_NODE_1026_length_12047_cov_169.108554_3_plen_562_part_00